MNMQTIIVEEARRMINEMGYLSNPKIQALCRDHGMAHPKYSMLGEGKILFIDFETHEMFLYNGKDAQALQVDGEVVI